MLYLFVIILFTLIVPNIVGQNPFLLWSNTVVNPQMFLTYIGSIFSALISIYIFKEYNDNGTELIISSKPLTRIKVVCMKFSACLTLLLTSSILFASISSLLLLTSSASGSQISGFLFSVITSGFALMLIYAMIATLVSFVLGKVWTILMNIFVALIFTIFAVTVRFSVYTPVQEVLRDNKNAVATSLVQNRDGSVGNLGYFISESTTDMIRNIEEVIDDNMENIMNGDYPFQIQLPTGNSESGVNYGKVVLDITDENKMYDIGKRNSVADNFQLFNATQQFSHMSNAFGLQKDFVDAQSFPFGSDNFLNYDITGRNNCFAENSPISYTYMPRLSDFPSDTCSTDSFLFKPEFSYYAMAALMSETTRYLGQQAYYANALLTGLSGISGNTISQEKLPIASISTGIGKKGGMKELTAKDLAYNDAQRAIFKRICQGLYEQSGSSGIGSQIDPINYLTYDGKDSNIMQPVFRFTTQDQVSSIAQATDPWDPDTTIASLVGGADNITNIWDYVHFCLCHDSNIKSALGIVDGDNISLEKAVLKFRYFLWNEGMTKTGEIFGLDSDKCPYGSLEQFQNAYQNPQWDGFDNSAMIDVVGTDSRTKDMGVIRPMLPFATYDESIGSDGSGLVGKSLDDFIAAHRGENAIDFNFTDPSDNFYIDNLNEMLIRGDDINPPSPYTLMSAFIDYALGSDNVGYMSTDVANPERQNEYQCHLYSFTVPTWLVRNSLMFDFKVTPKMQFYNIMIIWLAMGTLLSTATFISYYRKDFK